MTIRERLNTLGDSTLFGLGCVILGSSVVVSAVDLGKHGCTEKNVAADTAVKVESAVSKAFMTHYKAQEEKLDTLARQSAGGVSCDPPGPGRLTECAGNENETAGAATKKYRQASHDLETATREADLLMATLARVSGDAQQEQRACAEARKIDDRNTATLGGAFCAAGALLMGAGAMMGARKNRQKAKGPSCE